MTQTLEPKNQLLCPVRNNCDYGTSSLTESDRYDSSEEIALAST